MPGIERWREVLDGPLTPELVKERTAEGWRLAAVEWVRDVVTPGITARRERPPYGLRVAEDAIHLEEDAAEQEAMRAALRLLVEDKPVSAVAEELNRRGLHTREGSPWRPETVFGLLPRLIEAGPQIFASEEWRSRR
jgi:hypothetical protein